MKGFATPCLLLLALCLMSCHDDSYVDAFAEEPPAPAVEVAEVDYAESSTSEARTLPPIADRATRKVIRTASIEVEYGDIDSLSSALSTLVDDAGGYVASSTRGNYSRPRLDLTWKVPSEGFHRIVSAILTGPGTVQTHEVREVDRTREYVDASARADNRRALAARFRKLLDRAGEIQEVVEVERELTRVTSEIESFEARARQIDRDAEMSTISLTLVGPPEKAFVAEVSFLDDIVDSFGIGVAILRSLILGAVVVWPLLLIGLTLGIVIYRRRVRLPLA